MKPIIAFLLAISVSATAWGYTVRTTESGTLVKWNTEQIDVYLDPSLETLGNPADVYFLVENAFDQWVTEGEMGILINFVYDTCTPRQVSSGAKFNCVAAIDGDDNGAGGNTSITFDDSSGRIIDADIVFYKDAGEWSLTGEVDKINFFRVALHETGHFFGLTHSAVEDAAMYPTLSPSKVYDDSLDEDDVWGAWALYDDAKIEGYSSCSTAAVSSPTTSVWALLLELF